MDTWVICMCIWCSTMGTVYVIIFFHDADKYVFNITHIRSYRTSYLMYLLPIMSMDKYYMIKYQTHSKNKVLTHTNVTKTLEIPYILITVKLIAKSKHKPAIM